MDTIGFIKSNRYSYDDIRRTPKIEYPFSRKQIRKVEYLGPRAVYDIVGVKDTSRFVCNGICISNSTVGPVTRPTSPNIIGLGQPKRFKKPVVGENMHQGGVKSGHVDSQVTQINFTQKGNTNAEGNCPTTFLDMFVTSKCGTNGDSGSAIWSDDGYLVGIVTYGSTEHGGKNDRNCKGYNPSAYHMPSLLDVTTWGGTSSTSTPSSLTSTSQQQPRQRSGRGWGSYNYNFPTVA